MHIDSPHHRYFQAKKGRWWGKVHFEITDPMALHSSPLRLRDKWSMRWMAFVSHRLSTLVLSTTVDYCSRGHQNEVLHTTRISSLGITLFRSRESISLEGHGRSLRMTGTQAFFPQLWRNIHLTAHGEVAADHDGTTYQFPFLGVTLEQQTRMSPEGLWVVQRTPFSRADILLQVQPPPATNDERLGIVKMV